MPRSRTVSGYVRRDYRKLKFLPALQTKEGVTSGAVEQSPRLVHPVSRQPRLRLNGEQVTASESQRTDLLRYSYLLSCCMCTDVCLRTTLS
jgi:hypothetical protein